MQKNVLFIIDMQNDFCVPNGALYIPGAEKDVEKLIQFISRNANKIDHIIITLDNHQLVDISHPWYWKNKNGQHPNPFTNIAFEDVKNEKWIPVNNFPQALNYLHELETQREFSHTIWPEHCIMGTWGATTTDNLQKELKRWAVNEKYFEGIIKGTNPLTEHFGAFRANIIMEEYHETKMNLVLVDKLKQYDNIIIAGEARSHCVANTIKQSFDFPELTNKMTLLEDCMSSVPGFENLANPIYQKALILGARWEKSNVINL